MARFEKKDELFGERGDEGALESLLLDGKFLMLFDDGLFGEDILGYI